MSATSKKLPFCTRTSVIDHLFRRKYNLTYADTIIMSYILLTSSWADNIDDYYLLLTSKIKDDLLLGIKTIEATFTKLKKLELIELKRVVVPKWSHTQKYRTIRATHLGKEYNLSYHKPQEHQYLTSLEEIIEEYKAKNEFIDAEQQKIKKKNSDLELKLSSAYILLEGQEGINQKSIEILKNDEELNKKINLLEKELEEARAIIKAKETAEKEASENNTKDNTNTHIERVEVTKEKNIDIFRKKIVKDFSNSARILCNGVNGWDFDVKFYINTYNKVTVKLLTGEFKQLTDIDEIRTFWEWLFENQDRVGQTLKTPISATIIELIEFEGKRFIAKDVPYKVIEIKAEKDGVTILVENEDLSYQGFMTNKNGGNILNIDEAVKSLKNYIG